MPSVTYAQFSKLTLAKLISNAFCGHKFSRICTLCNALHNQAIKNPCIS